MHWGDDLRGPGPNREGRDPVAPGTHHPPGSVPGARPVRSRPDRSRRDRSRPEVLGPGDCGPPLSPEGDHGGSLVQEVQVGAQLVVQVVFEVVVQVVPGSSEDLSQYNSMTSRV